MKKVLFVVHTLQVGGAEKVLINLLKRIDKHEYDITVLSIINDGVYIDEVKNIHGVKYKYIFNPVFKQRSENTDSKIYKLGRKLTYYIWKIYLLLIKYFPQILYKKAIKEEYDVEIAFLEGKVSKFVSYSTNENSKKIAWIHTDIRKNCKRNCFKSIKEEKKCYKKFDKIVCVSEEVKKEFVDKIGMLENICIQTNPIPSDEIEEKAKEPITRDLNHNGLIVCSVGRLVKEKGYDRLLQVHKELIKNGIIHTLWIVGDGVEKRNLEIYIKNNHLENTVNLIGYTDNPYKYVSNADIIVCSSYVEGLSSAVLEATILEKVIVTTDCPGMRQILGKDDKAGIIVKNSKEGLYEGIKEILINEEKRNELANNIKKRSKLFEIDNIIKQIEKLIGEA